MSRHGRHILFYSESPVYGGAEEYVYQIAHTLGTNSYRFTFMHDSESRLDEFTRRLSEGGVKVEVMEKIRGKTDIKNFIRQVKEFRRLSPDIVHFNQSNPYSQQYSVLAARLAGVRNLLATYHLTPRRSTLTLRGRLFEKLLVKLYKQVIVSSEQNRAEITARFHVADKNVKVMANGVEDFDTITAAEIADLKNELDIHDDKHIVSCAGRLTRQKGFGFLLEALHLLGREDAVLVMTGDGPLGPHLESRAQKLGIEQAVLFTGFRNDVRKILCLSEFVVIPSLYEGQPLILLEAMAAGKAVIASRVYGLRDTVKDGETGILVDPGDPEQLTEAMGKLLDDPLLCRQMGQRGRERYEREYSLQRFHNRIEEVYVGLSDKRRNQ